VVDHFLRLVYVAFKSFAAEVVYALPRLLDLVSQPGLALFKPQGFEVFQDALGPFQTPHVDHGHDSNGEVEGALLQGVLVLEWNWEKSRNWKNQGDW
jgi:hypothetical protein